MASPSLRSTDPTVLAVAAVGRVMLPMLRAPQDQFLPACDLHPQGPQRAGGGPAYVEPGTPQLSQGKDPDYQSNTGVACERTTGDP